MEQLDYQQLVQLLQALPHDEYPQLFSRIESYDRLKVKEPLRVFRKPHQCPQYFDLCLKLRLPVKEPVPEGIVDVKKKYTLVAKDYKLSAQLLQKLKDEYFVVSKNRKPDALIFKKQYLRILDKAAVGQCKEQCLRLLKQSVSNIDTLIHVLIELSQTDYEIQLTPIYNGKQEYLKNDLTIQCLKMAHLCVKDLSEPVAFVSKIIQGTHDENRKFAHLSTLPQKQLDIIYNVAHLLNDDVKMFELVKRTIALEVPLNNWAYLRYITRMRIKMKSYPLLEKVDCQKLGLRLKLQSQFSNKLKFTFLICQSRTRRRLDGNQQINN